MPSLTRRYGFLAVPFGVFVGHVVGYRLAHPGGTDRQAALGSTHGYLGASTWIGLALAVVALAWSVLEGVRGHRVGFRASTLLRAQALAFVALELLERIGSSDPISGALHERGVWVGLAVQVVLALAMAALFQVGAAVGQLLAKNRSAFARRKSQHSVVTPPVASERRTAATGRGPPCVGIA